MDLYWSIREEDSLDGSIALCCLDSGYKQTFWLSIELLIELGDAEILKDGEWQKLYNKQKLFNRKLK
jgi:hypothetical protein